MYGVWGLGVYFYGGQLQPFLEIGRLFGQGHYQKNYYTYLDFNILLFQVDFIIFCVTPLQWRHNGRDGV